MKSIKCLIFMLSGLLVGQIFAEGESPLEVSNSLGFGYNDNLYRADKKDAKPKFFLEDTLDLSFYTSFSDRTDLFVKSKIIVESEENNNFYPNLYTMLNHSFTPHLLIQWSDTFHTGDKTGTYDLEKKDKHYYFWKNTSHLDVSYVLDEKTRIKASFENEIEQAKSDADTNNYNQNTCVFSWSRELAPKKTRLILEMKHKMYEKHESNGKFMADTFSGKLSHTFNPELVGFILAGAIFVDRDFEKKTTLTTPVFGGGLTYEPSPRTQFSGDFDSSYKKSNGNALFGGGMQHTLNLSAQHDLTAKIMLKSSVRLIFNHFRKKDRLLISETKDCHDNQIVWDTQAAYKMNRIHSIEIGYKYSRKDSSMYPKWTQNRINVNWRVEL